MWDPTNRSLVSSLTQLRLSACMFCQLDRFLVMLLLWHTCPLVMRAVTMSCCGTASRFLLFLGLWQKKNCHIGLVKSLHHRPPLLLTTASLSMHVCTHQAASATKFQGLLTACLPCVHFFPFAPSLLSAVCNKTLHQLWTLIHTLLRVTSKHCVTSWRTLAWPLTSSESIPLLSARMRSVRYFVSLPKRDSPLTRLLSVLGSVQLYGAKSSNKWPSVPPYSPELCSWKNRRCEKSLHRPNSGKSESNAARERERE